MQMNNHHPIPLMLLSKNRNFQVGFNEISFEEIHGYSIAIFGSKRPPKEKKSDKKASMDNKSRKIPHIRRTRDDTIGNNSRNSNEFKSTTDINDEFIQISGQSKKESIHSFFIRYLEGDTRSSSSISNDDTYRRDDEDRRGFTSSKSSSSSDTSDDDDNPMTKIVVKINKTKTQALSDDDDEARISTAMRIVDLNIGNFAPNTRGLAAVNE